MADKIFKPLVLDTNNVISRADTFCINVDQATDETDIFLYDEVSAGNTLVIENDDVQTVTNKIFGTNTYLGGSGSFLEADIDVNNPKSEITLINSLDTNDQQISNLTSNNIFICQNNRLTNTSNSLEDVNSLGIRGDGLRWESKNDGNSGYLVGFHSLENGGINKNTLLVKSENPQSTTLKIEAKKGTNVQSKALEIITHENNNCCNSLLAVNSYLNAIEIGDLNGYVPNNSSLAIKGNVFACNASESFLFNCMCLSQAFGCANVNLRNTFGDSFQISLIGSTTGSSLGGCSLDCTSYIRSTSNHFLINSTTDIIFFNNNSKTLEMNGGDVGIGVSESPRYKLHVEESDYVDVPVFVRKTDGTNSVGNSLKVMHETTGTMVDGFGTSINFMIRDTNETDYAISTIIAERDGANNSGKLILSSYDTGTPQENLIISNSNSTFYDDVMSIYSNKIITFGNGSGSDPILRMKSSGGLTNNAEITTDTTGNLILRSHATGSAIVFQTGNPETTQMRLDENGFLGVGTAPSQAQLHVERPTTLGGWGSINVNNAVARIQDSTSNMYLDGNAVVTDGSFIFGTTNTSNIEIGTNNCKRMTINGTTGNLALKDASGSALLHVSDNTLSQDCIALFEGNRSDAMRFTVRNNNDFGWSGYYLVEGTADSALLRIYGNNFDGNIVGGTTCAQSWTALQSYTENGLLIETFRSGFNTQILFATDGCKRMTVCDVGGCTRVEVNGCSADFVILNNIGDNVAGLFTTANDEGLLQIWDGTTQTIKLGSNASPDYINTDNDFGIGKTANLCAKVEILKTSTQLRLTHTNDVDYADFCVNANGDLSITPSSGNLILGNIEYNDGQSIYNDSINGTTTIITGQMENLQNKNYIELNYSWDGTSNSNGRTMCVRVLNRANLTMLSFNLYLPAVSGSGNYKIAGTTKLIYACAFGNDNWYHIISDYFGCATASSGYVSCRKICYQAFSNSSPFGCLDKIQIAGDISSGDVSFTITSK
jgi:hypothetical protein